MDQTNLEFWEAAAQGDLSRVVMSVNRGADPYLDATVRLTTMNLASASARLRWQGDTEVALNDGSTGIGQLMTGMFQNMDKLAAAPGDTSLRVTTLDSISRIADAFRQTAADLNTVSSGTTAEGYSAIASHNASPAALADINNSLLRAQPGTSAYAQLLDSRDAALQTLNANLNVNISFGARGVAEVSYGGQTLVSGDSAASLSIAADDKGRLALSLSDGTALAAPANGALGGLFSAASTVADRAAEAAIRAILEEERPGDAIIGEEYGSGREDAVAGPFLFQDRADRGFGGAVGLGHGRLVGLQFHVVAGAKEGADGFARRIGKAVGQGQIVTGCHGMIA